MAKITKEQRIARITARQTRVAARHAAQPAGPTKDRLAERLVQVANKLESIQLS